MCIACGGLPSKENNPCGLCGTDRDRLTYDPTVMQDDLLKRAAEVLRGIRMRAEKWVDYPDAKETLAALIKEGY